MGMTNREKFREVYGFDTDCGKCNPYPCKEDDCEWWEQCKDHPGCPCENWWDNEYKAPAAKNDLEHNLCDSCINYRCEFQSGIVRTKCAFYMPSITPQEPRWIPVSERLPEPFEFVNCTCHSLIDDREDWVVETCYFPQLHNSPYSDWGNIPMLNSCECEVIAWMHRDIPEPYKAESEKA